MTIAIRPVGSGPLFFKGLLYGPWGVGKNLFSAGAARHKAMAPVLVVNVEGGTITTSNVDGVMETQQLFTVADVDEVFWELANGSAAFKDFKTVVVDSGSAISQLSLTEQARANAKANKSEIRVSQQDYGDSMVIVLDLLRRYRNLPMHVITLASMREDFDTINPVDKLKRGAAYIGPDFPPALARRLMHVYDHVWALNVEEDGTRQMLTQRKDPYTAKTRGKEFAAAIGDVIDNPDLAEIFDVYLKTQGKDSKRK